MFVLGYKQKLGITIKKNSYIQTKDNIYGNLEVNIERLICSWSYISVHQRKTFFFFFFEAFKPQTGL